MNILENKDNAFAFEKYICLKHPELWKNEAFNLFSSAQVLLEFSELHNSDIFLKKDYCDLFSSNVTQKIFWHYKVIRMLWGYGFENLLKGIYLIEFKKVNPDIKEVPINDIKSHNLKHLFKNISFKLSEKEEFYIWITEKCSIWMGRYPMPVEKNQMYEQRQGLPSREALLERSKKMHEQYFKWEIPRIFCESDILHSGIGGEEIEVIEELKTKCFDKFSKIQTE